MRGARADLDLGVLIDLDFEIAPAAAGDPDAALLDPPGAEVAVAMLDFDTGEIVGRTIDFSGGPPVVGPEFPISSTPAAVANVNPAIAADPATGRFVVAWEHLTGIVGDPVGVRARRFDANGNPVGGDFQVETTTANAQGQPAVAFGPNG